MCRVSFLVTVTSLTLTSDLVSIIIVSGAFCLHYFFFFFGGGDPEFGVWMHLGMAECREPFLGHYDLDLGPKS